MGWNWPGFFCFGMWQIEGIDSGMAIRGIRPEIRYRGPDQNDTAHCLRRDVSCKTCLISSSSIDSVSAFVYEVKVREILGLWFCQMYLE